MASLVAIISGLAGICGAAYGMFKLVIWLGMKTPEQTKEEISKQVDDEEAMAKQTGRPPKA